MPESMIKPDAGSILNVTGRRSAIVVDGPRPGSTPTAVPMVTPTRQIYRLCQERETEKPILSASTKSMTRLEPVMDFIAHDERAGRAQC
jgi:hypothetical protein